jgi:peroxiredoxin
MHRIKAVFIATYMMALMASLALSIWQLATAEAATAWWGVLLAAAVPMAFFTRVFVGSVARTGESLWWIPAAGALGVVVAAMQGGVAAPSIVALLVGVVMGALYTTWYSRFGGRPNTQLAKHQVLPDFPLEDINGSAVSSHELISKPALWLFFRGNWCPLCMAQIKEIAAQYRSLAERGVEVLLISPQPQSHSEALAKRFDAPMRFLTDRDNRAAAQLGILAEGGLPMGMQALGYDSDVPMPTVLITAPGGKIVYSDLTDNYRIRPEPGDFIEALDRAGL